MLWCLKRSIMQKPCYLPLAPLLVLCLMAFLAMSKTDIMTDQSSLLNFRSRIHLDPSHILSNNWSVSTSVCDWIGVTCSFRHQRVTALNISSMNLTGNVPSHQLGNLSFLVSIDLSRNYFHGSLPQDLIQLRRLRAIDFSFNDFGGEIPSWFGFLAKLELLNLANNSFTGFIPPSLSNISTLQSLVLSSNGLQGKIPQEIGNLHNLKTFTVDQNMLTGLIPLPIFNISTMERLSLGENNLTGNLPLDICHGFPRLKSLYLGVNDFQGEIPSNVSGCSQLQYLSLSYNKFSGSIPREIGNITTLEFLNLAANDLTGEIPQELGNLENLVELVIGVNNFTGSIPASVFNISSLQYIYIAECNVSGPLPENICSPHSQLQEVHLFENRLSGPLPTRIDQCSALQSLWLHGNSFSGSLPGGLGNLTMLRVLHVWNNQLTGVIPQEIANLQNLELLYLGDNYLAGSIPTRIFNMSTLSVISVFLNQLSGNLDQLVSVYELPNLEDIFLNDNNFSGKLPNFIANSSKLTKIGLSGNNFTGTVSNFITALRNCRYLIRLHFAENPLNGNLPVSVGNLPSSLGYLHAYNCDFHGSIPEEIGNLSNLVTLALQGNQLTGSIPTNVVGLRSLQGLGVNNNRIRGSIPDSLCNLENLSLLALQQNQLSGRIPECIGKIATLRYLYLNANRLNSSVPLSLWHIKELSELNLSSNFLSGTIPKEISMLKVAALVDLSMNEFSGIIPSTIGDLNKLVNFSLAHNKLQGSIPDSMGEMLSLESVNLSHNNLSGIIPLSLEELHYLKHLNVSFNHLTGEIPSRGPFANFTKESFLFNEGLCGNPRYNIPPCRLIAAHHQSNRKKILRAVFIALGTLGLILISLIFAYAISRYRRKAKVQTESEHFPMMVLLRVSHDEIFEATDGYSESNLLGAGGFGSVYSGILRNGMRVAVKVFSMELQNALKSFDVECEVLRNLRHRNLCKVISSCSNLDFKALVLEYMSNGNLEKWLYSHNYHLDIKQRIQIMIDIAAALEYLHHGYSTPIIHCDLKPSNVLLDEDMVAHLSDFGISKLLSDEESIVHTITLATFGYIAPEYGREGLVSTGCDVYSYGIMLMEVFTRAKPSDERFSGDLSLRSWVCENVPTAIFQIIDSNLLRSDEERLNEKLDCLCSIMELAINCSVESAKERSSMKDVLVTLKKIQVQLLASYA